MTKRGRNFRGLTATGLFVSFLLALFFAVAPGLHEGIHSAAAPGHECAVTIFLSGKCDYSGCDAPSAIPHEVPPVVRFISAEIPSVIVSLEFSLLEHAPPAFS